MRQILAFAALAAITFPSPGNTADTKVSDLAAATPLTGSEAIYCVQNGADRKCSASQLMASSGGAPHPGYKAGLWYRPDGVIPSSGAGAAAMRDTIVCYPGKIDKLVTIDALALRVATAASGNVQAAIYSSVDGRPGAFIASTPRMKVSLPSTLSVDIAPKQVGPGGAEGGDVLYFCTNSDNSIVRMMPIDAVINLGPALIGSSAPSDVIGVSTTQTVVALTAPHPFGAWPADLSAVVWTNNKTRVGAQIAFRVN